MSETVTNCHALKPVPCGCGGEASMCYGFEHRNIYAVECNKCGICTCDYDTASEAITAWNRAMGNDYKSKSVERTAKVIRLEDGRVVCSACLKSLGVKGNYCRTCGAKLDWSGNEQSG